MKTRMALALSCLTISGWAAEPTSRTVACRESEVIPLNAQINYATLIQFAPNQTVVGAFWGDTDRWSLDKTANLLVLKPSVKGTKTDIHVVTSTGDVCSFAVREIGSDQTVAADLKVRVTTPNDKAAGVAPVFYSAAEVATLQATATEARKQLADEKQNESAVIEQEKVAAREKAAASIEHKYTWEQNEKARRTFGVSAIYNLDGFTVIEANAQETPAVYETRDGKPSLIEATFKDGKYTIPKIVDEGYLRVGKSRLTFKREG